MSFFFYRLLFTQWWTDVIQAHVKMGLLALTLALALSVSVLMDLLELSVTTVRFQYFLFWCYMYFLSHRSVMQIKFSVMHCDLGFSFCWVSTLLSVTRDFGFTLYTTKHGAMCWNSGVYLKGFPSFAWTLCDNCKGGFPLTQWTNVCLIFINEV